MKDNRGTIGDRPIFHVNYKLLFSQVNVRRAFQASCNVKTNNLPASMMASTSFDQDRRMTVNSIESAVTFDAARRITGLTCVLASRAYGYSAYTRRRN